MPKVQPTSNSASGRSGRARRVTTSLAEINVVPLVDVMLVLLIIFMIAAPMIQRGVDVNLPVVSRSTPIEGERVIVSVPATYRDDRIVFLGDEPVRSDVLQERIRQEMERVVEKEVYLRGDGVLSYQEVMDILGRLKAAGVLQVGLETDSQPRTAALAR
jgi:biopolymer transport protein ExbD